jgi:hypothetical protein
MISDLNYLRDIGSRITTGKTAEIQAALGPYAEALGIKVDKLDDLQAYNAVVARLQPRMRVAGSGATSDYEMRTFLEALPSLGKTQEGNAIIANTLEALQQQHLAAGEIASKALAERDHAPDAEKQLRELPDPFELWKKSHGSAPSASQKTSNGVRWSIDGGAMNDAGLKAMLNAGGPARSRRQLSKARGAASRDRRRDRGEAVARRWCAGRGRVRSQAAAASWTLMRSRKQMFKGVPVAGAYADQARAGVQARCSPSRAGRTGRHLRRSLRAKTSRSPSARARNSRRITRGPPPACRSPAARAPWRR